MSNVPVFPKKLPIVLIATLATVFLAATVIVAGEFLGSGTTPPPMRSKPSHAPGRRPSPFGLFRRGRNAAAPAAAAAAIADAMPIGDLAKALSALGDAARRITVIGTARNVGTTYTAIGLARALAQQAKVVLVDLALGAPNISIMSVNPGAPGIAELVTGNASFGECITRDRFSRTHLIATGKVGAEPSAILTSPRLAATLEALARTYDHVVIDAGAISEAAVTSFARLAPRAVLVATDMTHPDTVSARQRLIGAGFTDVTVFLSHPRSATEQPPAAA